MSLRRARIPASVLPVAAMAAGIMLSSPAHAVETVNVTLQDPSTNSNIHSMKMTATPGIVKAGPVKIVAVNKSRELVHEVIVIRQKGSAPLPYNSEAQRVIEKQVDDLGEVSDLDPGKSGSLTVNLTPGEYLLICNQPDHYKSGMWTRLTVTAQK